jgi:uncharacterized membrane protein
MGSLFDRLARLLKHQWLGSGRLPRSLRGGAMQRLAARVAQSETRHSGQIRICLEASLPWRYVWRDARARERAISLFGSLRVWDTEHNNGVLIYLLLAERSIEIVADRALARQVPMPVWSALIARMAETLRSERFEEALNQAIDEVSELLERHCAGLARTDNELPDTPVIASDTL